MAGRRRGPRAYARPVARTRVPPRKTYPPPPPPPPRSPGRSLWRGGAARHCNRRRCPWGRRVGGRCPRARPQASADPNAGATLCAPQRPARALPGPPPPPAPARTDAPLRPQLLHSGSTPVPSELRFWGPGGISQERASTCPVPARVTAMIVAERGEMGSVLLLGTQLGEVLGLTWPEPRCAAVVVAARRPHSLPDAFLPPYPPHAVWATLRPIGPAPLHCFRRRRTWLLSPDSHCPRTCAFSFRPRWSVRARPDASPTGGVFVCLTHAAAARPGRFRGRP